MSGLIMGAHSLPPHRRFLLLLRDYPWTEGYIALVICLMVWLA